MDLQHEVVLACLEEDNARNGYFRAFPLLTPSGVVQKEAAASWPDDGALRIIPDRGERSSFKDRMRQLGDWCVIDITRFDPSSNKIRSNKNYHPENGEVNQFIVFSDAVAAAGDRPFIEVLEGRPEQAPALARGSITPLFFVRDDSTWYGPVRRNDPVIPDPAEPMEGDLFRFTDPRGAAHAVLCPAAAAGALPIGQKLEILDRKKSFEETLASLSQPLPEGANLISAPSAVPRMSEEPAPKLSGTPLTRTSLRFSEPTLRNRTQQLVSGRAQASRNAEPPAPPVPFSTDLPVVPNPAQRAEDALAAAWTDADVRPRLAKFILSLDGMKIALDRAAGSHHNTALMTALQYHLQSLEAERLRLLMELDHAREDMAAFRTRAIESATQKARRELDGLKREQEVLTALVENLRGEANSLLTRRDSAGVRIGVSLSGKEVLHRLESAFNSENLPYHRERAAVWLALIARPGTAIGIVTDDVETAAAFAERYAAMLGWPFTAVGMPDTLPETTAATPVIRLSLNPMSQPRPGERVIVALPDSGALAGTELPVMPVGTARFRIPEKPEVPFVPPTAFEAVLSEAPFTPEDAAVVLQPVFDAAELPRTLLARASTFASVASGLLIGGLAAACDWAIALWVVPRLGEEKKKAMLPALDEYPRARALC